MSAELNSVSGACRKCYTPADLRIGSVVTLRGRPMLLYACDGFTRRWYAENLGYTAEELADMDIREPVRTAAFDPVLLHFRSTI
jgi:DUF1126 PH-like domain